MPIKLPKKADPKKRYTSTEGGSKGTDYKERHKPITERIGRLQGPTPSEVFRKPVKGRKKDVK